MNILVNAISIREGGSKVVLEKLLAEWLARHGAHRYTVAVHPCLRDALPAHPALEVRDFPGVNDNPVRLLSFYQLGLPRLAERHRADVLFSMTNYLPLRRLACPSVLLVQHAGHFSKSFGALMERHLGGPAGRLAWRLKGAWVRRSIARAGHVTVQTRALADAIQADTGVPPECLTVVPHGPGLLHLGPPRRHPGPKPWRIGLVAKFGVQKDFATVFRAVAQLRGRHDLRLVTSLDQSGPEFGMVRAAARSAGVEDLLDNAVERDAAGLASVYARLDLFVFPSLCESFGFPLVEAMAAGLPLVAVDIASTREVAGEAPLYHEPGDWAALAAHVERLIIEPEEYDARADRSVTRAGRYAWAEAADATLALLVRQGGAGT